MGVPYSESRYTTRRTFDYQEAEGPTNLGLAAYTGRFAINISQESFFNADLNGDGKYGPGAQLVGNIIRIDYPDVVLLPGQQQAIVEGGPTQQIREVYQWNEAGQPKTYVDPEGNVTDFLYFAEDNPAGPGNPTTPGGMNANGLAWGTNRGGFREAVQRDARALNALVPRRETAAFTNLVERYFYRDDGCVVATRDARGIRTDFTVNPWNLVNRVTRAADVSQALLNPSEQNTGLVAFAYFVDTVYDFNQNVVSRHVENRDGTTDDVGSTVDYTYTYDILDNLIEETAEATASVTLVTQYLLDPNENVVTVRSPLAVAGIQPNNAVATLLDERDLVFRVVRGPASAEQSDNELDYNGNRRAIVARDGADNDGDGLRDQVLAVYDGFDRLQRATSPVGTEVVPSYDPASHVVRTRLFGTAGGASPVGNDVSGNELLAEAFGLFDELARGVRRDQRLFTSASAVFVRAPVLVEGGASGSLVPADGNVNTLTEYDRASRVAFTVTDDLEVSRTEFDGVHRAVRSVDPEGNEVRTTFDGQHNPILTEEIDKAQIAGIASETFRTIRVFDALGRIERETDNIGQTRRFFYDSRDNLRATSDAQGALISDPLGLFSGQINANGNTTETFFDGVNRVIAAVRHLRVGGTGAGAIDTSNTSNADGMILVVQQWDRNSNLVSITDDGSMPSSGGNTTSYVYDNLNRKILDDFADPTTNTYTLDADDNVRQVVDENGSVISMTFDGANRLVRKNITRASGVVGTTLQEFEWDGLSRQTRAFDDNEPVPAADNATVTYAYDSLSRLLEEVQNGRAVSSRWAADDDRVGLVYPDGRQILYTLDRLDRLDEITEGGGGSTRGGLGEPAGTLVARYRYIGRGRVLEREYGNGLVLTYLDPTTRSSQVGYDGARRIVGHRHIDPTTAATKLLVAGFAYGYNRENYRTFEVREHQNAEGDAWQYDSVYRIIRAARDVASPAAEAATPGSGGTPRDLKTWQFDGLGNWDATVANGTPSSNTNNEMNEYTAFGGTPQAHDDNGNLKDDGALLLAYDFQNRLRSATRKSDGALLATYAYDAHRFGRRVRRALTAAGATAGQQQDGTDPHTVLYLHDDARVVEEALDGTGPVRQYVDGNGIDEHLQLLVLQNRHQHWYHEDAKGWVAALTKSNGQIEERVTYDVYGAGEFRDSGASIRAARAILENVYLFQGRRLEPECTLYHYRARDLHILTGRFVQRDPVGAWRDAHAGGNNYAFAGAAPTTLRDPRGLDCSEEEALCTHFCGLAELEHGNCLANAVGALDRCLERAGDLVLQDILGQAPATVATYLGHRIMADEVGARTVAAAAAQIKGDVASAKMLFAEAGKAANLAKVLGLVSAGAAGGMAVGAFYSAAMHTADCMKAFDDRVTGCGDLCARLRAGTEAQFGCTEVKYVLPEEDEEGDIIEVRTHIPCKCPATTCAATPKR